ncbi:MAG: glutamate-5-semialdehyde dehydrogenase [Bacteroidales bacterium]|nr:glutamate-5-semialdehyde dehydrogenase [Bacteroidales bacterium]
MEQTQLQLETVKDAARTMVNLTAEKSAEILNGFADAIVKNADAIIEANQKDLSRMDPTNPMYDRLMLTLERIEGIASDTRKVATLEAPCGEIIENRTLPNNLQISKVRVPLGVVGVIYEARPNVTVDVAALCIRSGNAVVLKGGSDAADSNAIIVDIMHKVLENCGVNPNIIQLLPPKREAANILMNAVGYVDVLIPRGSKNLINAVRNNSKVPVIETGAGVVHTYFDIDADLEKGTKIICNAKTRRVSVCNALECLIINSQRLKDLPYIAKPLAEKKVEIIADQKSFDALKDKYDFKLTLATEDDFGVEYNALKLAIKTVDNLDEALNHIYKYSTKHSEAIITENIETAERFVNNVDAACCYINTSTAFTDGAQFGLGAEIGISTQKLHARGPMALKELTSYKWIIKGDGQIRLK